MDKLQVEIDDRGCATLRLNNPERHNCFDGELITEMTEALEQLASSSRVRVVTLCSTGKSFCAGADLIWMGQTADCTPEENLEEARHLATLFKTLKQMPMPTIALVQGATYGGGIGLVAACDIALAGEAATFCLSEVRLGLIAATIAPYLIAAIGERAARRYLLSAEHISAGEAQRIGLVHQVVVTEKLETTAHTLIRQLLQNGPAALTATKQMIEEIVNRPFDDSLEQLTAKRIAAVRASPEGREGVRAFLQKRTPSWSITEQE